MTTGLGLLLIVLSAVAALGLAFGLERWLRQPGLAFLLIAVSLAAVALYSLKQGRHAPALYLGIQVPGFLYFAHFRRTLALRARIPAPEA